LLNMIAGNLLTVFKIVNEVIDTCFCACMAAHEMKNALTHEIETT
jgi:hypothetical protein